MEGYRLSNQEKREKALKLKEQGKSYQEIGDELGVPKSTIGRWCKEKPEV